MNARCCYVYANGGAWCERAFWLKLRMRYERTYGYFSGMPGNLWRFALSKVGPFHHHALMSNSHRNEWGPASHAVSSSYYTSMVYPLNVWPMVEQHFRAHDLCLKFIVRLSFARVNANRTFWKMKQTVVWCAPEKRTIRCECTLILISLFYSLYNIINSIKY